MKQITPTRADILAERIARHGRHALLVLGCGLVLSLLVSSFGQAGASLAALEGLQLQAERTGRLDSMLIQLVDAENGVRGYLLTRNRAYLEPYLNSLATVKYTLEDMRQDTVTRVQSEPDFAQLTGLITLKMRILSDEVARGRFADEAGAAEGRRYMDSIRKTLAGIKGRTVAYGQHSLEESIAHVQRTRWVVATLSGGALVLLLILFVVLRRQVRLREQIAGLLQQENLRLEGQVRARTAELSDLASYLTRAREVEQARLARELHDELGALLTAARMDIAWIMRKLDPAALLPHRDRFDRLIRTVENGIALKRRITDDLRPPLLQELGLVAALRTLGEEFAQGSGVKVTLDLPDADIELPPESALAFFRIAQESLTNIRRHSGAHKVRLALQPGAGSTRLVIEDDGVGFDPAGAPIGHHGMAGMRHRVQMFNGDLDVDSAPGHGTRIVATLPVVAAYATMSP